MKNILVMGLQASGISASALLTERGWTVRKYDDKLEFENNYKNKGEEIFEGLDMVLISPAIPNVHPVLKEAKKRGIPIVSELDLGGSLLKSEIIMITGTNGKTTTVDMVNKGFAIMGRRSKAMGNIGYPVSQVILDKSDLEFSVIEASSFQLEYTSHIKPKVAALLNVAPDHIDRYDSYADYVEAKKRVFLNQTSDDYAILNYDSKPIREMAENLKAKIIWISVKEQVGDFYIRDNYYYYNGEPLISARESKLKGDHNRFNMMTALNIMNIFGGKREHFISLIKDYKALPHRVEYVSTIDGKTFYNDSKGTNIAACKTAIETVSEGNIGLILGGSDKHEEFCEFFDSLGDSVKFIAVTGGNDVKIYNAAMKVGFQNIKITSTLTDAIKLLYGMDGIDTILFSPACASFDRYSNYAERGEIFKGLVYALKS